MSKYDYPNACPTCGAQPYRGCRTLKTDRATDTHRARIDAQFEHPRFAPIRSVLEQVYGTGSVVTACAFRIASRWEAIVENSRRYDPDDAERTEQALFSEVHQAIWMMFPGGSTAEHAAERVKAALVEADLWGAAPDAPGPGVGGRPDLAPVEAPAP